MVLKKYNTDIRILKNQNMETKFFKGMRWFNVKKYSFVEYF